MLNCVLVTNTPQLVYQQILSTAIAHFKSEVATFTKMKLHYTYLAGGAPALLPPETR